MDHVFFFLKKTSHNHPAKVPNMTAIGNPITSPTKTVSEAEVLVSSNLNAETTAKITPKRKPKPAPIFIL